MRSPFAAGPCQPQLAVAWEPRWRNLASNVRAALLGQKTPREIPAGAYFNGFWMGSRLRRRALLASALWHVAIVVFPFSLFPFGERRPTDSHPLSNFDPARRAADAAKAAPAVAQRCAVGRRVATDKAAAADQPLRTRRISQQENGAWAAS